MEVIHTWLSDEASMGWGSFMLSRKIARLSGKSEAVTILPTNFFENYETV